MISLENFLNDFQNYCKDKSNTKSVNLKTARNYRLVMQYLFDFFGIKNVEEIDIEELENLVSKIKQDDICRNNFLEFLKEKAGPSYLKDGFVGCVFKYFVKFYLKTLIENENMSEQEKVLKSPNLDKKYFEKYNQSPDEYVKNAKSVTVKKNPSLTKKVLVDSNFKCKVDENHETFLTVRNQAYMEGHHLIPCNVKNSESIKEKYNSKLDREENIVCICPNCHRAVHFGTEEVRRKILTTLYNKQKDALKRAGIDITLNELLDYYD